jgi:type II restriction enzyme
MATAKQDLGALGEQLVVRHCACPRCKRARTLRMLPPNFKCADVICDFCGYLGQVKASTSADGTTPPKLLLGAAWGPQKQRMDAGIYFPLFLVLVAPGLGRFSIHYLSADLQTPELFLQRKPLSETARRAGWQGFYYNLGAVRDRLILLVEGRSPRRRTGPPTAQASLPAPSPS